MYTLLVHHVSESTINSNLILLIATYSRTHTHTGPAYEMMKKCGLNEKCDGSFNFFPTIHDAVHQAKDNIAPISIITETS